MIVLLAWCSVMVAVLAAVWTNQFITAYRAAKAYDREKQDQLCPCGRCRCNGP